MIPKIIHYCWFGRNPLPESVQKCISSWHEFFPDYEIKEWNEDNFNINIIPYTQEAYDAKKYAFVSDYARLWILYHEGGIYFDTDVEVIKSFDDILSRGAFMGCEIDGGKDKIAVAMGLGVAIDAGNEFYQAVLEKYTDKHFKKEDGQIDIVGIVPIVTNVLISRGLKDVLGIQQLDGITIYPSAYFNPLNDLTGQLKITPETHSIHWYSKTWVADTSMLRVKIVRFCHRVFGVNCFALLKKILRK